MIFNHIYLLLQYGFQVFLFKSVGLISAECVKATVAHLKDGR